jgi:hypothetical protein
MRMRLRPITLSFMIALYVLVAFSSHISAPFFESRVHHFRAPSPSVFADSLSGPQMPAVTLHIYKSPGGRWYDAAKRARKHDFGSPH